MATRTKHADLMTGRKAVKLPNGAWTTVAQGMSAAEERAEIERQADNYQPYEAPTQIAVRSQMVLAKIRLDPDDARKLKHRYERQREMLAAGDITLEDIKQMNKGRRPDLLSQLDADE